MIRCHLTAWHFSLIDILGPSLLFAYDYFLSRGRADLAQRARQVVRPLFPRRRAALDATTTSLDAHDLSSARHYYVRSYHFFHFRYQPLHFGTMRIAHYADLSHVSTPRRQLHRLSAFLSRRPARLLSRHDTGHYCAADDDVICIPERAYAAFRRCY